MKCGVWISDCGIQPSIDVSVDQVNRINRRDKGTVTMEQHLVGVDAGGTNIRMGIVTPDGRILKKTQYPMDMSRGGLAMMDELTSRIQGFIREGTPGVLSENRIGIGIAGPVDFKKGVLIAPPNLPDLHEFPLREFFRERISPPIAIENDANAFTLGEGWKGAARGCLHYCGITLGTGVGGGVVVSGKILHGADGMGGEVGHMALNPEGPLCGCGGRGCLEVYASGNGIRRMTLEAIEKGEGKGILHKSKEDLPKITSEDVFEAAQNGDETALKVFNEMGRYLGLGLVNLVNLFNPERIVIGGKVSRAWDYFIGSATEVVYQRAMKGQREKVKIVRAGCGDDA
ncbi:MAG: ROK family protein, partial [Deltaproteobacteria bacterium]|nr:ROK family protein [Deltaproteobacteria bacterium]